MSEARIDAIATGLHEWQKEFSGGLITSGMKREMAECILRQPAFASHPSEPDCDMCCNRRIVLDGDLRGYHETAPCPKCRDGSWAYKAMRSWFEKYHAIATTPARNTSQIGEG